MGRVQSRDGENGARRGGCGAPEGWAGVAVSPACDAVRVCVKRGVGRGRGAQEHDAHSGRIGRPDDVTLAWVGGGARSRSSKAGSGN
jgi:hypothetical protein